MPVGKNQVGYISVAHMQVDTAVATHPVAGLVTVNMGLLADREKLRGGINPGEVN